MATGRFRAIAESSIPRQCVDYAILCNGAEVMKSEADYWKQVTELSSHLPTEKVSRLFHRAQQEHPGIGFGFLTKEASPPLTLPEF